MTSTEAKVMADLLTGKRDDAETVEFEDIFEMLLEIHRRRPGLNGIPVVPCDEPKMLRMAFLLFDGEKAVELFIKTRNYRKSLLKHSKSEDYRYQMQAYEIFDEFRRGGPRDSTRSRMEFVNGQKLEAMHRRLTSPLPPSSWDRLLEDG